uniref:AB hydrolase-1 domain-containing protein n=1 Tax=Strix occidentalis caurina TaxID=311401 RepID=A0A8D0EYN9_STROC
LARSPAPSKRKFPVPWGHVAAKAWGPSEGHPVLCMHGWLDNANTFDRLIPLLPRDYYYVAMDFSGHGLSSHRPAGSPYHFLDYVTDVRRVVAGCGMCNFASLIQYTRAFRTYLTCQRIKHIFQSGIFQMGSISLSARPKNGLKSLMC